MDHDVSPQTDMNLDLSLKVNMDHDVSPQTDMNLDLSQNENMDHDVSPQTDMNLVLSQNANMILDLFPGANSNDDLPLKVSMDIDVSPHTDMNLDLSLKLSVDHDLNLLPRSSSRKKYDVFISFRGEDTRNGFTGHLHTALVQKQIKTYIDDQLVRGDEIKPSLLDAIKDSQISVVILSENYASSSWCLDELVHILHCKENSNQIVVPVFYKVNPSDVRKQGGSYAAAFEKHEQRYNNSIIQKWRTALTTAANLSGWDAPPSRNESELIGNIVKDIMGRVKFTPSSDYLDGLVGIDESIKDLKLLLFSSSFDTRKVGIWGMGGVGKTTLARAVYNQVSSQFQGQCFVDNVREKRKTNGPTDWQLKLFADLLKERTDQVKENMQAARERLRRKKLLIVLDDVDDDQQYRDLVEDYWLNPESRVILTSRDQQVLRSVGVDDHKIYNVKPLYDEKASELFCLHAFKKKFATEGFEEMSREFVNYAAGNPLALRVLGSHLTRKSEKEWRSLLNKLRVRPDEKIHNILKISYDGLDDVEKEIFLDIACLFKGWSEHRVEKILDYGGCFAVVIGALKDKCLINISDDGDKFIGMHDLLEEMALEIVRHKQPEEQSRLWNSENMCDVLRNNAGTPRIEAIFLQDDFVGYIELEPDVFQKMKNLRLLQISNNAEFQLPRGLYSFPNSIRYLSWFYYPLDSLGSHFTPNNLVHLYMPFSQLKRLWNGSKHNLENLKFIDVSFSKKLKCLPNLSSANLSRLDLEYCTILVELPPLRFESKEIDEDSMDDWCVDYDDAYDDDFNWEYDGCIHNMLNLKGCSNLKTVSEMFGNIAYINLGWTAIEELHPSIGYLNNLRILDLRYCDCLKDLPVLPPNLKALNLSGTLIKQVDESSFEHLLYLEILDMNSCLRLETLPTCLCKLKSLQKLFLFGCSELKGFPEILEPMELLYELLLDGTGIKELPSSIENLNGLKILDLRQCKDLESIPTSICKLKSLSKLYLSGCCRFNIFPEILEPMELLDELSLAETGIKELPSSIENLNGLEILDLGKCKNLKSIPTSIYNIKCLKHLHLNECPRLKHLPAISFESFECITVRLSYSNILQLCDSQSNLSFLEMLDPSDSIPICIIRKRNEDDKINMSFTICKCGYSFPKDCKLFLEKHFGGDHWTEGSTRFTRYRCSILIEFLCCFCYLNEAYNILTTEFLPTILHKATTFVFKQGIQVADHPRINISYPGNKIPEWFIHHTVGSSIDINFSPLPHDSSFLGFALCIVVGCDDNWFCNMEYWNLSCEYHFKNKDGGSHQYRWTLQRCDCAYHHEFESKYPNKVDMSCHVFIWHLYEDDYHDYHDATGASFKFYINKQSDDLFGLLHRIKECGIRRLTLQDTEEFGICKRVPAQNTNSDTNEPHPKRIKTFS